MKKSIYITVLLWGFTSLLSAQRSHNLNQPYNEQDVLNSRKASPNTMKSFVAPDFELDFKDPKTINPFQKINDLGEVFIYELTPHGAWTKPQMPIQKMIFASESDDFYEFVLRAQMLELKQFVTPNNGVVVDKNH